MYKILEIPPMDKWPETADKFWSAFVVGVAEGVYPLLYKSVITRAEAEAMENKQ